MDMVFMSGLMEIVMKVNLKHVLNMEKELKNLRMVIIIRASILMDVLREKENIFGKMVACIKGHLKMGLGMEKEPG